MIVFNEEELISASISTLARHFQSFVILDMGSTDRTRAIVRETLGERALIIEYDQNELFAEGYAAARNFCVGFATSPWVLVVDADEVLVSGISEAAIRIDLRADDVALATVAIQNLERPVAGPPVRKVRSTVRPRRLYRPTQVRWEGYIHEALALSPASAQYRASASTLVFDHYTEFKDRGRVERKREMYYWMLLRAYEELPLRAGTNSYWYEEFVPKHLNEIKRGAQSFERLRNSTCEKIKTANDAVSESVLDTGCIRTLHTVSAREWIGQEARIAWCE